MTTKSACLCVLLGAAMLCATGAIGATLSKLPPTTIARQFYEAWHLNKHAAALKFADKVAVDKLFETPWRMMKFEGCDVRDEGGFECVYRDAKNDFSIAMIIDGGASVGGYNVTSVSFSSEE